MANECLINSDKNDTELDVYKISAQHVFMRTTLASKTAPASTITNVTSADWIEFRNDCVAAKSLGGERGAIAAKMLDIGERMQALSAKVDAALKKYCS